MNCNLPPKSWLFLVAFLGLIGGTFILPSESPERNLAAFYKDSEWLNRCSREIETRIKGRSAALSKPWRNDNQHVATSWANGLNLTSVTIAKGSPRGVAVTPRHVVYTKHFGWHPQPGQTISFLTIDNRIISRVVDQVRYLSLSAEPDLAVIRLNDDLPGSISPMKIVAPLGLPDVAKYTCPVLRIDQENKALLVAVDYLMSHDYARGRLFYFEPTSTFYIPRVRAFAPFYEPMVRGDSSSPSILIYRDQYGVTPFLLGQVTSAGTGTGPNHSALSFQIQAIIRDFGDTQSKYRIVYGPYEFSGHQAPSCSVYAARIDRSSNCLVSVLGSGDATSGNPTLTPRSVYNWTKVENTWTTTAFCPQNSSTVFVAQLTGPGGVGRSCESAEIKEIRP